MRGDGSTLQAFAGTLGTWVHAGLSPATPNFDYQAPIGQYGYDPNLATDATNRTVMAWYSSASGQLGVLAQDVGADGSPVGAPQTMPGTSDMQVGMLGRTPLAARSGGGFYVAYPTGYRAGGPPVADRRRQRAGDRPHRPGSPAVAIAAAGDGRLWVLWTKGFGDPDVLASARTRARRDSAPS